MSHFRDCDYVTNDGPAPCTCGAIERECNQAAVRAFHAVGCGTCKGTGLEHKWNQTADLVPTGKVCPACNGTALARAH